MEAFGSEASDLSSSSSMALRHAVESIEANSHILHQRVDNKINSATFLGSNSDNID
jgi:hypothetical protein